MDKFNLLKQHLITHLQNGGRVRKLGFTMAEILLSLTIIGVVAAITLPSLTGNINERTWNTQRKALYARMSQAITLMGSLNGYGQYEGTWSNNSVTVTKDTAAKTFVTDGLAKVLKINNICDAEHFSACGLASTIYTITGSKINFPKKLSELNIRFITSHNGAKQINIDTKIAAFETQNGESIATFYNPQCKIALVRSDWESILSYMCANFIFDLNGKKGPNTVGKDIGFMTALFATDSSFVAPAPMNTNASDSINYHNAIHICNAKDNTSRIPTIDELIAMSINNSLLQMPPENRGYWSSSLTPDGNVMIMSIGHEYTANVAKSTAQKVRCIKR